MDFSSSTLEAAHGRLLARFGARVEPWWESLPAVLERLAERWQLEVGDAVGRGNTSLVVRCRRTTGEGAVLKLSPAGDLVAAEASALRLWQPSGRVPFLWEHDRALGALLLEAIADERPLSELALAVEPEEIADLIRALHAPATRRIPDVVDSARERIEFIFDLWVERHARGGEAVARAVPVERLHRGRLLARELAAESVAPVLLHGDLHAGNVLRGGPARGLVAIDPRPCLGDAAIDAVDWVFWSASDEHRWQGRSRRLATALRLEHERLWAWCAAFAAMLATSKALEGDGAGEIPALLAIAP